MTQHNRVSTYENNWELGRGAMDDGGKTYLRGIFVISKKLACMKAILEKKNIQKSNRGIERIFIMMNANY